MVHTTADAHGFLFKHSHAGRGFSRVEHAGLGACVDEGLLVFMGHGGNAAHALADVEHETLGGEQALLLASHREYDVARHYVVAVVLVHGDLEIGIETMEDFFGGAFAGEDAFFLDHQLALAHGVGGNATKGGVVAVANVLGESQVDETVGQSLFFFFVVHNDWDL